MIKIKKLGSIQVLILPAIITSILIVPTLNSWFGLADDHLFVEAIRSTNGTFGETFKYYFNLQPWSHSPRFNPSELFGWTIETFFFGSNALSWRIVQLIALLASSIAVGISIRKISKHLGYSANRTLVSTIIGQATLLALPFWSETIGRIGAPETFASVSLSFIFLNVVNTVTGYRTIPNLFSLGLNTVILVGFKENLIVIGIASLIFQFTYLLNTNRPLQKKIVLSLLAQITYIVFVIIGFLPELLDSGQAVNGAEIGLNRIVITKWIIVPMFSFCISLFAFVVNLHEQKSRIFQINILFFALILIEYFIMAGRLSGHYGFLSSILLTAQFLFLLHKMQKFQKSTIAFLLCISTLGISINISSTLDYLNRTAKFKHEINNLSLALQKHRIDTVVINVDSLEEYEAVSSITSFTTNRNTNFYLKVADALPEGLLKENLVKYSNYGFEEWHLRPIGDWQKKENCISIQFSSEVQIGSCKYAKKITWLND